MSTATTYKPNPDARIEAIRWDGNLTSIPAEWRALDMFITTDGGGLLLRTNKGLTPVGVGEYIVRGTASEFYPVTPAVFHERWMAAES